MRYQITRLTGLAAIGLFVALVVPGQSSVPSASTTDRYLVSAKAGGVNFVSGSASVVRSSGGSGLLLRGDRIDVGDRVTTGANGRLEVLLNPGSYLRLGADSAFEFKTTSLDDLQIHISSGSAIFEVFATKDFLVTVTTPGSTFRMIESGVYKINVAEAGTGTIAVRKGKAELGDRVASVVKSGREATVANGQASITRCNNCDIDELDIWSKSRARDLARLTARLDVGSTRTALMRSYLARGWNMYNSFGLWIYDPFRGINCFLPFGWGWGSPYGFGFGNSIYYFNLPSVVFTPPPGVINSPVAPVLTTKPGRVVEDPVRPPFAQVQGSSNATGGNTSLIKPGRAAANEPFFGSDSVRSSGGFSTGTVSAPPPPPPSPPPAPVVMDSKPGRRP